MGGRHITVEEGRALAAEVLGKAGLTAEEAAAVADIVVWTELTGYPQIGLARLPRLAHGTLIWYCTRHGLMYQYI